MTFLLCIIYLVVMGAGIVSMAVLCLRGKKAVYNKLYLVCQGLALIWCGAQICWMLSETQLQMRISNLIANTGICFIGAFWFYFALLYTKKNVRRILWILPTVLAVFHYMIILTNGWHHLYYKSFGKDAIEHGIFFYTNVAATYLWVISGAVMIYGKLLPQKREKKQESPGEGGMARVLIVMAVLVPVILNLMHQVGIIVFQYDVTPLGFGISMPLILLATIRYRFMDVNITAFDTVLAGLSDGVGIFDKTGKCTYYNKAFMDMTEREKVYKTLACQDVLNLIQEWKETEEKGIFQKGEQYIQVQIYQSDMQNNQEEKMKPVSLEQLCREGETVFVFKDISRYYEVLHRTRELAITNEKLALERERNRIAGEVHDTAGHTLTMIQSYMKLALISSEKEEKEKVEEYLTEAKRLSGDGIRELRQSINQLKKEASYELVTQGIMQLAAQVKEIEVEVTVQGEDSEKYSHLTRVLYESVREIITNTLKYAQGTRMDIILRFQENAVELVVADDGRGCEEIVDNNGLYGIRKRIKEAGGDVKFISSPGEGFLSRIQIPL